MKRLRVQDRASVLAVLLAVLAVACGQENHGFAVAPVEDIQSIAFVEFPDTALISETTGREGSTTSVDGGQFCTFTGSSRNYELAEPVLFSQIQAFYNDVAVEAGWEVENTRSEVAQEAGRHPAYVASKFVNGRQHAFEALALQPDRTGNFQVQEDELVVGFEIRYVISADPEHPFC